MNHFEFGLAVGVMTKSANPGAQGGGFMGNLGQMGGKLMGAWNSMPSESRTAIAAGVPAALAGLYLHHRGNTTAGTGLGLAGLAAAGVGAAHAGMFGQGAQKFVAPHVKNVSNMASQFMGGARPPVYGAADHDHGQAMQGHLENQLQNASATPAMKAGAALAEKLAAGRCWTGYEPVPGKAPYSNDSCRPKGTKAKKKKTEEKEAKAATGKTTMTETPSSRGTTKQVDDAQTSGDNPKPEDAGVAQLAKASQAPVPQSVSVWGGTLPKTPAKPVAKPAIPKSVSAWGAAPSQGPVGYIDNQAARSWGGM